MFTVTSPITGPDDNTGIEIRLTTFAEVYPVILRDAGNTKDALLLLTRMLTSTWRLNTGDSYISYQAME